jgi:hypothetical protein
MSKSNAVPIQSDSESEVFMSAAKASHTIMATVTLDPGKPVHRTVSLSEERLSLNNGDEVIWDVRFIDAKRNPVINRGILEVRFSASSGLGSKSIRGIAGGREVGGVIKGSFGKTTHSESYSVFLDDVQLRFVSTSNPPLSSPSLVIQPVGDPPGEHGSGSGPHRG